MHHIHNGEARRHILTAIPLASSRGALKMSGKCRSGKRGSR